MNRRIVIAWVLLVLVVGMLLWWWQGRPPEPVWQPVTRTFDPEHCAEGKCKELLRLPPVGDDVVSVIVDPGVDDETAQWSDCLASVAQCVEVSAQDDEAGILRACVRDSQCPTACREHFAGQSDGIDDADALWRIYEQQFVLEGGLCVPGG